MKPTKERSRHGRTQTATAVRIDNDLLPYLNAQPNKAMAINKAIRVQADAWHARQQNLFESCEDCPHWQEGEDGSRCEYPDSPPCDEP